MAPSSLARPDHHAQVRHIFREQLHIFITRPEPAPKEPDPDEIYQNQVRELELLYKTFKNYFK